MNQLPGRAWELFPCSGGMSEGFRRAGITFAQAFDFSEDACDSYEHNHGHRPIQIDVRDLVRLLASVAPSSPLALVVADPPCTPWSRAGSRLGLADERDMLATTVDALELLCPTSFLIGNVPGLDDAPNAGAVESTIGRLRARYCVDYVSLDAADYGVPQHRVRPFWFGHPIGTACIRWPLPTHGKPTTQLQIAGAALLPHVTCRQALQHLTVDELGKPVRLRWKTNLHPPSKLDSPSNVIPASQPGNGGAVLACDHRPNTLDLPAKTLTKNTHGDGALLAHPRHPINKPDEPSYTITSKGDCRGAQGACVLGGWPWDRPATTIQRDERMAPPGHHGKSFMSARDLDRPATTVTARDEIGQPGRNGRDGTSQSFNAIKLSERAGAILQGFPEGWLFSGKTKKARWAQIGMAMPPGLAQPVAESIAAWFRAQAQERAA